MRAVKTLVLGASEKPDRYSNMAVRLLQHHGHPIFAFAQKAGTIGEVPIHTQWPTETESIDTVTLYLNPTAQAQYTAAILALKPRRIIFNPGTENDELVEQAAAAGIQTLEACTLVMLRTGQY
jgi:uncharacterized protein